MKKTTIAFLVLILGISGLALGESGRGGGGGGFSGGGGGGFNSSNFSRSGGGSFGGRSNFQSMSRGARSLSMPSYGPRGESFHSSFMASRSMSSSLVRNNMSMARSSSFESRVRDYDSRENVVGHYYWHNYNGQNFCHYYDRWGCNWYGWKCGGGFYWSCWWGNYWWWYDPDYYRWCYWDNGWYWEDPYDSDVYSYQDGQYAPVDENDNEAPPSENNYNNVQNGSESSNGTGAPQLPQDLSSSTQASSVASTSGIQDYESQDHARMIKVVGASRDAFLYNTAKNPSFKTARYLASGVQDVRFSKKAGKPLQIMLGFTDGSFELYNAEGKPVQ